MTRDLPYERPLTRADMDVIRRADALLDRLSPAQMRAACEWLFVGVAQVRPTNQSMADWLERMERTVGL